MDWNKIKQVYFIGAGGIGMSALVRYFLAKGKRVAGYDKTPSELKIKMKPYITVGQISVPCATVPINFTVGRDAE